jgi:hypothetical protein
MTLFSKLTTTRSPMPNQRSQRGFTLMETACSLVIMMIVGLGVASLFAYATRANANADDRELAMAIRRRAVSPTPFRMAAWLLRQPLALRRAKPVPAAATQCGL